MLSESLLIKTILDLYFKIYFYINILIDTRNGLVRSK